MTLVSVSDAKTSFSKLINRAAYGRERIVLTSHGQPKAALVSMDDLRRLEELEDAQAVSDALAEHERGETITLAELEAELSEATSALRG
ncbi:MAG: type II toxin-antitoxin system prevent-host-death family antitoxin [Ardenticatenales bacterium]|jgi:prevent-host-death family protein|nr:type II toxin-antitoxin system prevent-host-death family antitoxin [Ardenticatenales bacterium]